MPCYEPRDRVETVTVYESGISPDELRKEKDNVEWLQAALCAVLSEMDQVNMMGDFMSIAASVNGKINLVEFWAEHKKKDRQRLLSDIHNRYSVHELRVIKEILDDLKDLSLT